MAMQVPPSCSLDEAGVSAQRARYARLAPSVGRVTREPGALLVAFDQSLDEGILQETLAAERECCPFFRFAFDPQRRGLRVTVDDPAMAPALEAIAHGFEAQRQMKARQIGPIGTLARIVGGTAAIAIPIERRRRAAT